MTAFTLLSSLTVFRENKISFRKLMLNALAGERFKQTSATLSLI
jgi:hypothetical protein